jgi:hypothetical protein
LSRPDDLERRIPSFIITWPDAGAFGVEEEASFFFFVPSSSPGVVIGSFASVFGVCFTADVDSTFVGTGERATKSGAGMIGRRSIVDSPAANGDGVDDPSLETLSALRGGGSGLLFTDDRICFSRLLSISYTVLVKSEFRFINTSELTPLDTGDIGSMISDDPEELNRRNRIGEGVPRLVLRAAGGFSAKNLEGNALGLFALGGIGACPATFISSIFSTFALCFSFVLSLSKYYLHAFQTSCVTIVTLSSCS